MKSYSHLYEKFIDDDNVSLAIRNAAKGKRNKRTTYRYVNNPEWAHKNIKNYAENYSIVHHTPKIIYDGITRKKRTIIVPTFKELAVQHMVVNVMKPIFYKGMYEHTYASIPNRGAHKGKKVIEKWIRGDRKNCKYCLKMDIKKYFDSIPQEILLAKLNAKIHDKPFMSVLEKIVKTVDKGLPLGFYTS